MINRRRLLQLSGTGFGMALTGGLSAFTKKPKSIGILKPGDKIKMKEDATAVIQKAYDLGFKYEKTKKGCARCTVAAMQDAIPFVEKDEVLFRGSTCLDGGATPSKIASCGAFTGSGMVISYVCGTTREGETFTGDKEIARTLIHKVYDRFEKEYGSVLCENIREVSGKTCPEVVGRAASWVAEILIDEFVE